MVSTEMSAPFREMMNSMADSLYGYLVDTVAQRRGLPADRVREIIDDPPMTARGALEADLIDGLYYRDQLLDDISGKPVRPAEVAARADDDDSGDDDDSTGDCGCEADRESVDLGLLGVVLLLGLPTLRRRRSKQV